MINELYYLSKALDNNGIAVDEWHRKYSTLPNVTAKSPCIRIWLDDNGMVCGMESLSAEHARLLRKYGGNQGSFPAFNISPLYRITEPDIIAELEKLRTGKIKPDVDRIRAWCTNNNWIKGTPGKVKRSMRDRPRELMGMLKLDCQTNIVAKLAALCQKAGDSFRTSLENCAFDKLKKQEDIPLMLSLLFHVGSNSQEHTKDTGNNISIILDVYNWAAYGYPVASEHTTVQLNALLLKKSGTGGEPAEEQQLDAFGTPFVNPDEPMPSVKLAGFEVILRSMYDQYPCQYRYKQIKDKSYPIAAENRASIKKALEWISRPSNRQITWVKLVDEIAFIYPSKLPDVPLRFASLFGRDQNTESKQAEARFESVAKNFVRVFQGIPLEQKPDRMQIFTIRKIDSGRSKVVFTHNSTPEQLMAAAESWSAGCNNLPAIDFGEIDTPFPLEIPNILNAVWKQNGERADGKKPVRRMKYYQGMELFLDALPKSAIHNFLHIETENAARLFVYLGYQLHSHKEPDDSHKRPDGKNEKLKERKAAAAQALTVLGLLLYKCEITKEYYMEKFTFLLGQWLHVSDELHTLYCMVKRDGDIPPRLAGSALLVSAGEMPYQALAQLYSRMNPFISWAKQYRYQKIETTGKESWRAAWLLSLFEQLADQIMPQMDRSIRFGDFEKAALYIGYMSSLPKKEKPTKAEEIITGGMKNE